MTEHAPKVSTRSVNPYARESSPKRLQQDRQRDRQTDRHTHRDTDTFTNGLSKTTFLDVRRLYIPNAVLSQTRLFARCQHFHEKWKYNYTIRTSVVNHWPRFKVLEIWANSSRRRVHYFKFDIYIESGTVFFRKRCVKMIVHQFWSRWRSRFPKFDPLVS